MGRTHIHDERARFYVADPTLLPPGTCDVVVSGLVLNFIPEPGAVLTAMRARSPKGIVAAYVWDYSAGMELIRRFWDAAVALDDAAADLDEGIRFAICRPELLDALWRDSGFVDVATRAIDVPTVFQDFNDYWTPFLGGQGSRAWLHHVPRHAAPRSATRPGTHPVFRRRGTARSLSPPALGRCAAVPLDATPAPSSDRTTTAISPPIP